MNRIALHTAALALSGFVTLVLLGSLDTIAARQVQDVAAAAAPVQQVVTVGQRFAGA